MFNGAACRHSGDSPLMKVSPVSLPILSFSETAISARDTAPAYHQRRAKFRHAFDDKGTAVAPRSDARFDDTMNAALRYARDTITSWRRTDDTRHACWMPPGRPRWCARPPCCFCTSDQFAYFSIPVLPTDRRRVLGFHGRPSMLHSFPQAA